MFVVFILKGTHGTGERKQLQNFKGLVSIDEV